MKHGKKMIAPVIITIIIVAYFLTVAVGLYFVEDAPLALKAVLILVPLALAGMMIGALYSRIKEIKGGENTDYISGKELEMLGLVKGSTIQSKNAVKDISQGFKTLVGGELKAYTEMMDEARAIATKRMVEEAERLGADAVVNIRYASSAVMQGAAEVMAYGTAVKFR